MNGLVVVDASLAVKWLVEEVDSDKAHAILQSWNAQNITRIAPHLMPFEELSVASYGPPTRGSTERKNQR